MGQHIGGKPHRCGFTPGLSVCGGNAAHRQACLADLLLMQAARACRSAEALPPTVLAPGRDYNITELQAKYIRPINPAQIQLRGSGPVTSALAPSDDWDWRPRKVVPPIRPLRRDCSAGWAEAAAAAVQSRAVISKTVGTLPALSVQQLIDCTAAPRGFLSKGCAGGYPGERLPARAVSE